MAQSINEQLTRIMRQYANGVGEIVVEEGKKAARQAVNQLKATSPELTGDYAKGWRVKVEGGLIIVHNATDYQLTHLLEKGHLKRDGTGRVAPKVHIEPVEQRVNREFVENVERRLS